MFVELLQGNASDQVRFRVAWERVLARFSDEATGYLGATSGASADGVFVALLGFESEEAARINMDHLGELASISARLTVRECPHVRGLTLRDAADADVIHVSQGPALDIRRLVSVFQRARRAAAADESVLGGLLCWDDEGFVTTALYRRSHDDGPSEELETIRRDTSTLVEHALWFDLAEPWSILARPVARPAAETERDDDDSVPT